MKIAITNCLIVAAIIGFTTATTTESSNIGTKAAAPSYCPTFEECECQCIRLFFRRNGQRHGNCETEYKGAEWCYVEDHARCANHLVKSRVFPGKFWSYEACTTLGREECYERLYECQRWGLKPTLETDNEIFTKVATKNNEETDDI